VVSRVPGSARVVVVGGGVMGTSAAYHLAAAFSPDDGHCTPEAVVQVDVTALGVERFTADAARPEINCV
jgi:glycine/D-amino acid oxidase-like deaminating enzyme